MIKLIIWQRIFWHIQNFSKANQMIELFLNCENESAIESNDINFDTKSFYDSRLLLQYEFNL